MDDKQRSITDLYTPPQTTTAISNQTTILSFWNTRGRIGRLRYIAWLTGDIITFSIVYITLIMFALKILSQIYLGPSTNEIRSILFAVSFFIIMVTWISFTIRCTMQRIQDFNYNKWLAFLVFVPFINILLILACILIPGTAGANKYAPPPPKNSIGVFIFVLIFLAMLLVSFTPYSFLPYLMYFL